MQITQVKGEYNIAGFKKSASETFEMNDAVTLNSSGYITKATASTPRSQVVGLIQRDVLATDGDYAKNSVVAVNVFDDEAEFDMPVEAGTPAQAMVGKAYDLNSEDGIALTKQVKKHFKVTQIISATVVRGKFLTDGEKARLVTYKQTVAVAQFTDGGSTSGTLALDTVIPAGAVFVQSMIKNVVGFAGDTTATIIIGDGSDTDRYNTGTPTVFATAVDGVDLGVPSGTKFHSGAKTPTVTITSTADFTTVVTNAQGSAEITLMWYEAD
jgi:hypothetical protein